MLSKFGPLAGLEADLEHSVSERIAIEVLNGEHRVFVVGHRDKAEALALAGDGVADDLDGLHGAEGPEQLPEHGLLGLRRQIVNKEAPSRLEIGSGGGGDNSRVEGGNGCGCSSIVGPASCSAACDSSCNGGRGGISG